MTSIATMNPSSPADMVNTLPYARMYVHVCMRARVCVCVCVCVLMSVCQCFVNT